MQLLDALTSPEMKRIVVDEALVDQVQATLIQEGRVLPREAIVEVARVLAAQDRPLAVIASPSPVPSESQEDCTESASKAGWWAALIAWCSHRFVRSALPVSKEAVGNDKRPNDLGPSPSVAVSRRKRGFLASFSALAPTERLSPFAVAYFNVRKARSKSGSRKALRAPLTAKQESRLIEALAASGRGAINTWVPAWFYDDAHRAFAQKPILFDVCGGFDWRDGDNVLLSFLMKQGASWDAVFKCPDGRNGYLPSGWWPPRGPMSMRELAVHTHCANVLDKTLNASDQRLPAPNKAKESLLWWAVMAHLDNSVFWDRLRDDEGKMLRSVEQTVDWVLRHEPGVAIHVEILRKCVGHPGPLKKMLQGHLDRLQGIKFGLA